MKLWQVKIYKARYIVGGHLDIMKDQIVYSIQTIQCVSVGMILVQSIQTVIFYSINVLTLTHKFLRAQAHWSRTQVENQKNFVETHVFRVGQKSGKISNFQTAMFFVTIRDILRAFMYFGLYLIIFLGSQKWLKIDVPGLHNNLQILALYKPWIVISIS